MVLLRCPEWLDIVTAPPRAQFSRVSELQSQTATQPEMVVVLNYDIFMMICDIAINNENEK